MKLRKLEKELKNLYKQALKDIDQKSKKFFSDFERLDKQHEQNVKDGKETKEEWYTWRKNKMLYGQRFDNFKKQVTNTLYNTNKQAIELVNDNTAAVFISEYNKYAQQFNKQVVNSRIDGIKFDLINENVLAELISNEEIILPPRKNMNFDKDTKWNGKKLSTELLQGILQGESMQDIAKRFGNVAIMNQVQTIRTARTMTTASENSGRYSMLHAADKQGMIYKKIWKCAHDDRTRESHLLMDGEGVYPDETFSNGLRFPADWMGAPAEVYNCRCTMTYYLIGFKKRSEMD